MEAKPTNTAWRILIAASFLLLGATTVKIAQQAADLGMLFVSRRWTAVFVLALAGALMWLGILALTWTGVWERDANPFGVVQSWLRRLSAWNLLLFLLPAGAFIALVFGPLEEQVTPLLVRLGFFWLAAFVGGIFLAAYLESLSARQAGAARIDLAVQNWPGVMLLSGVLIALVYKLATFWPQVSTYPFSLSWSEASRYYYASLFFAPQVYGVSVPPSALHPSRYLMQSLPFVVPELPIWFHRLWQALLWVGFTWLTAYILAKRLSISNERSKLVSISFMAWAFLFLFQGPVYYHLLVCALIVLWGFERKRPWKSFGVVLAASAWAGISRLNWFPVPGLLAACLYFLEVNMDEGDTALRALGRYLKQPIAYMMTGTFTAFGVQQLYFIFTGANRGALTSSFTSDLLWYRLLPSATYPLGILPAIALVAFPLVWLIVLKLRGINWVRQLGLSGSLLVLFSGGVVVSVKIGGGSNLHNLDAFLTLLLVVGAYAFYGKIHRSSSVSERDGLPALLLALIVLVPVVFTLTETRPEALPDRQRAQAALGSLREMTQEPAARGEEILFISQRHLLTFGQITNVSLVDEYENVFLMEMAMADNTAYLNAFYQDLREHRFALIVSDPQRVNYKGRDFSFGEENDAWVARVTEPLRSYYQREKAFKDLGIEVYAPKP